MPIVVPAYEPEPIDQDTSAVVSTPVKMDSAPRPERLIFLNNFPAFQFFNAIITYSEFTQNCLGIFSMASTVGIKIGSALLVTKSGDGHSQCIAIQSSILASRVSPGLQFLYHPI